MNIVIVGGNDCMACKYKELCERYNCKAKVFTQPAGLKCKIGSPDLMVLFTNTVSHKMIKCALAATKGSNVKIARSHSSSMSALKSILEEQAV
ncbi:MAG: DUF2325 domain-containing protein [Oscillospiraceae bacterium]|nr:DUF2325 domain-containing protein [Oscillospiraceae bacterium]